jgi:hypothetical protein
MRTPLVFLRIVQVCPIRQKLAGSAKKQTGVRPPFRPIFGIFRAVVATIDIGCATIHRDRESFLENGGLTPVLEA